MKNKRFHQAKDMEWQQPVMKGYLMGCCDCSLVHRLDFRIVTNYKTDQQKIQFRATRAPKYTARERRLKGIVVKND